MIFKINGRITKIFETRNVTEKLAKRDFVVEYSQFYDKSNVLRFELINDRCVIMNNFSVNDIVSVSFDISGREWTNPQGEVVNFISLVAIGVEPAISYPNANNSNASYQQQPQQQQQYQQQQPQQQYQQQPQQQYQQQPQQQYQQQPQPQQYQQQQPQYQQQQQQPQQQQYQQQQPQYQQQQQQPQYQPQPIQQYPQNGTVSYAPARGESVGVIDSPDPFQDLPF